MPKYTVKVLVTYTVIADTEKEAQEIFENGAEYPLMPYGAGWSDADEIISIEPQGN